MLGTEDAKINTKWACNPVKEQGKKKHIYDYNIRDSDLSSTLGRMLEEI